MQGYGFGWRRCVGALAAVAAGALVLGAATGCSLLADEGKPTAINIPTTDALLTESETPSVLTTASRNNSTTSYAVAAGDSYRHAIESATRVGVGNFHRGASTETGERVDGVSGVHFSTPDRAIRCSTGNNSSRALACASASIQGPKSGANTPAGCEWQPRLAVLGPDGIDVGACANLYPVLYRSSILEYGSSISAGDYSCLNDADALYCLDSDSGKGFSIGRAGVTDFRGDDRAPASLRGNSADDKSAETDDPTPTSSATPTR